MSPSANFPTLGAEPDPSIIARIKARDIDAVRALFDVCGIAVYDYVAARLYDREVSEAVCSDVIVSIIESLGRTEGNNLSFSARLYRIAYSKTEIAQRRYGILPQSTSVLPASMALPKEETPPPVFAARLLVWCLSDTNREEVEGDLMKFDDQTR